MPGFGHNDRAPQKPFTVGVDPGEFDPDEILRICKKAKVHPKQIVCYCTNTTAGEIAAAILKGAQDPGSRIPDDREHGPDARSSAFSRS